MTGPVDCTERRQRKPSGDLRMLSEMPNLDEMMLLAGGDTEALAALTTTIDKLTKLRDRALREREDSGGEAP